MPNLTIGQYDMVFNSLSFTIAAMGAAFVFFLLARTTVAYKFQRVLEVGALITGIACYHYVRMFGSWTAAYQHESGSAVYTATNELFHEAYRYADWLLTVPLLLVELVAVLYITQSRRSSLMTKLVIAAVLMIVTGYPGEVSANTTVRLGWGFVSTIPFVYILFVLWTEVGNAMKNESDEVKGWLFSLRLLLLASWGVYPIAYLLPLFNLDPAVALVGKQVGYSIADVVAKPIYGLMIYAIARIKTQQEKAAAPDGALVPHDAPLASSGSAVI
ncbi:MAG: bacteriorhodopsin [Akkermansiaceae bacterium]|nr:bacteriorhodopsin [Armatimonadota bacterium]